MNASAHVDLPPPSTLRAPPRIDLFGPIHKAIRCALGDTLTALGSTSFADERALAIVLEQLDDVIELCEDHRGHEDAFVMSTLAERLRGKLDSMERAHDVQPKTVAELRALARTLRATAHDLRPIAGRTLYLHFSTFAADLLLHMAEEEQVVQPLLERSFDDDELRGVHARLMASLTPAERARAGKWLARALNPVECEALMAAAQGGAR
ncbi:MAG: hypothetical protein JWP87_4202 [Labilithrix sp.]|nr:hypothetical protein [Labilithrix sp.]